MTRGDAETIERFCTGIAGLDTILSGGLPRSGAYVVEGPPGSGKTVLGNQLCFNHVKAGGRALYVTLLGESHANMLRNLRSMRFFDPEAVASALFYISGLRTIEESGLPGFIELLRREVQGREVTLLVIDGFSAVHDSAATDSELKKFVYDLQLQMGLFECTAVLLTSALAGGHKPEQVLADGVLELRNHQVSSRRERRLEVSKLRGTSHLDGEHAFQIAETGLQVFPRFEALLGAPARDDMHVGEKVTTGIARLDELFGGGLPSASSTIVMGPSGVGKTVLGVQFLGASTDKARGVYLTFYETLKRAHELAAGVGVDLQRLVDRGIVTTIWTPTTELLLDDIAHRLVNAVRAMKATRVLIDGLDGLRQLATDQGRFVPFFTALANELRRTGVNLLCTHEHQNIIGGTIATPTIGISAAVENMILLRYVESDAQLRRLISLTKVRETAFDQSVREFSISDGGIQIGEPIAGISAGLTGVPRMRADQDAPRGRRWSWRRYKS